MQPFRVLFVCTGNICRSPTAERLLTARLAQQLPAAAARFEVRSAGTLDLAGAEMEPQAATALAGLGVPADGHHARRITASEVAEADLVLGMTREHRGAAIELFPRASARAFTLFEFARYCRHVDPADLPAGDPVERARNVVEAALGRRGLDRPEAPSDDDLIDPLGAPAAAFEATAAAIDAALRPFLVLLTAASDRG